MDNHYGVLFVSLEMSRLELAERMLCSRGKINGHNLRNGTTPQAVAIGLVGPAARACGLVRDVRFDHPAIPDTLSRAEVDFTTDYFLVGVVEDIEGKSSGSKGERRPGFAVIRSISTPEVEVRNPTGDIDDPDRLKLRSQADAAVKPETKDAPADAPAGGGRGLGGGAGGAGPGGPGGGAGGGASGSRGSGGGGAK